MTNLTYTLSNSFNLPVEAKILGQKSAEDRRAQSQFAKPYLKRNKLKHSLLGLASAAVLAAMTPLAAKAQDNDVDAFDGTVNADCAGQTPIGATASNNRNGNCLLYTSPSPRDQRGSRMPSSA